MADIIVPKTQMPLLILDPEQEHLLHQRQSYARMLACLEREVARVVRNARAARKGAAWAGIF
jgi:hypothetical protein